MQDLTDREILELFHKLSAGDRATYIKYLQDLSASQQQPPAFPAATNE